MPVKKRNPLSITAADVKAIGDGYKTGWFKHDPAHTVIAGRLKAYSKTDDDRLAHWTFLIDQVEGLANSKTSLCQTIVDLFNSAFGVLVQTTQANDGVVTNRLVSEIVKDMRAIERRYNELDNVVAPDHLDVARINRIGSSYRPGFFSHKGAHAAIAGRLKTVSADEVGATAEVRWEYLAKAYESLESNGTDIAVRIRSLCKDAFGSEPSTGFLGGKACAEVAGEMRTLIQKHYHPGAVVESTVTSVAQLAMGGGDADL